MTGTIWRLTWRRVVRRRRLLAWNLLVPGMLLVPVVASGAAAAHRAIVVAVFVTFFGAYGNCIPLIRDGMSGWTEKVLLTGYGGRRWLVERVLASAAVDWAQLLPTNLLLVFVAGAGVRALPAVLAVTAVGLLFANLLGALVASGVRALGEAALGCAVASLLALHAAGVFRSPAADSAWATVEAWNPLRPLHETWLELLSSGAAVARVGPPAWSLVLLFGLMTFAAPRLAERLRRPRSE